MINLNTYQYNYPLLASFAKEDPTYTRKSKTGKMVVVRKGKRKGKLRGHDKVFSTLGGIAAGSLASLGTIRLANNHIQKVADKGLRDLDLGKRVPKPKIPIVAGSYGAALGAAGAAGYLGYKFLRGDRGKEQ